MKKQQPKKYQIAVYNYGRGEINIAGETFYFSFSDSSASCSCSDFSGIDSLYTILFSDYYGFSSKALRIKLLKDIFRKVLTVMDTRFILISTTTDQKEICELLDIICHSYSEQRKSKKTGNVCKLWIF